MEKNILSNTLTVLGILGFVLITALIFVGETALMLPLRYLMIAVLIGQFAIIIFSKSEQLRPYALLLKKYRKWIQGIFGILILLILFF